MVHAEPLTINLLDICFEQVFLLLDNTMLKLLDRNDLGPTLIRTSVSSQQNYKTLLLSVT